MAQWLAVVGFEGRYEVSDFGRVRSLDRQITRMSGGKTVTYFAPGKLLSVYCGDGGYPIVNLGGRKVVRVHVIVLTAFVGPKPLGCEVRHLNGNPLDSRLVNLQWCHKSTNNRDRKWHKGAKNQKLRPEDVKAIRKLLADGSSQRAAATEFNISQQTVSDINTGKLHIDV